ncbi:MAG: AIDA repeat-containing protein, partial [Victivallaceae bacterium]
CDDGHVSFSIVNGVASNFLLESGGKLTVLSGHSAIDTMVSCGTLIISSGGVANSNMLNILGSQYISFGGIASYTTISAGGKQIVYGVANSTIVNYYGSQYVSSGGVINSTTIKNYGSLFVYSGGTANMVNQQLGAAMPIPKGFPLIA